MSAIKNINANEGHRDIVASDRTLAYTDGYKNLFTNATTPSVADIVTAGGVVELSNVYTLGTFNLFVYVNGQLLVRPGDDYGETDNRHITLSTFWVSVLNADPVNNNLLIVWNRPLPGARDQLLQNLKNVTPDIEGSVLDNDVGGPYRAALATPANPLATLADVAASAPVPLTAFRAARDTPLLGITAAVTEFVAYNSTLFNVGSGFNAGTGRFTAPATGYYQFNGVIGLDSMSDAQQATFYILKNGIADAYIAMTNNPSGTEPDPGHALSVLMQLNSGQTASLAAAADGTANGFANFSGFRVG